MELKVDAYIDVDRARRLYEARRKATELKSCAHCGSKARIVHENDEWSDSFLWHKVICSVCLIQTDRYATEEEAIAVWNCREEKCIRVQDMTLHFVLKED